MDLFVYDLTWIGSAVMLLMIGLLRPVASAAHSSFTAHMLGHLLLGMIAPLMLVHSAPVTLALRALPVQAARVLSRVLRSPGARVLTHPVVAGTLNAGGLWLIYATDLFQVMHVSPVAYALVHLHALVVGYVFTASLIGVDPDPHRASMALRSTVLVPFIGTVSVWVQLTAPSFVTVGRHVRVPTRLGARRCLHRVACDLHGC